MFRKIILSEKLQTWTQRSGVLSSVVRLSLASAALSPFIVGWFFILVIAFIALSVLSQQPTRELTEEFFMMLIFVQGLLALPTLYVVYMMTHRVEKRPLASVGLSVDRQSLREFLSGLVLGIILASSGSLALYGSGVVQIAWNPVALTPELIGWIFVSVLGWFGVAFWEELYFRGYSLQTWASGLGIGPAVVITSVSFGVLHVMTYGMKLPVLLDIAFMGVILAFLYLKTKSLWAPIGMHFANNFWSAHILPLPIEQEMNLPLLKVNDQPVPLEVPHWLFQAEFAEGKGLLDLYSWDTLPFYLFFYVVVVLLIWKLPWLRPHPEMEALWRQYVPIAQPWVQLKGWWARRRGHPRTDTTEDPPREL